MGQAEGKEQMYLQRQDGRALCSWTATSNMGAAELILSPHITNQLNSPHQRDEQDI